MKKKFQANNGRNNSSRKGGYKRKRILSLLSLFALLILLPATAIADKERYVLDFNDSHIRGHRGDTATIYLKRTLKAQYPWVRIGDLELKKVILVAKSKRGHGGAQLRVGDRVTEMYGVDGRPRAFHDGSRKSFDKMKFWNPSHDSRGPWHINLRGNFKVRKVVLVVDERKKHNYYGQFHRNW